MLDNVSDFVIITDVVWGEVFHVNWNESGDFVTIQEGIDVASDGDEAVVADGTYTGDGSTFKSIESTE